MFDTKCGCNILSVVLVLASAFIAHATNPICDNYDKSMSDYHGCVAFNDKQFMQFFEDAPTYSDGEPFGEEGSIRFNEVINDTENESRFTKDGIVYSVRAKLQYSCEYEVFPSANLADEFRMQYSDKKYVANYGCAYEANGKYDTTFAETEFQKFINVEEMLIKALTKDFTELEFWKFYRQDGTLKYTGDIHGGFCMSANGMKKTKRVTSPKYCK